MARCVCVTREELPITLRQGKANGFLLFYTRNLVFKEGTITRSFSSFLLPTTYAREVLTDDR